MKDAIQNVEPRFRNVYEAINAVMCDIEAVGKKNRNEQQKYLYRGIDDVMSALAPAMRKYGLFVIPEVLDQIREEKDGRNSKLLYSIVKVKYTFRALDGSSVEAVVIGEGMDSGDKATNKAMSAAFKYALIQTFCIPTDELVDSEKDSPEVAKSKPKTITPEEAAGLWNELRGAGVNIEEFLKQKKIKDLQELTPDQMVKIYGQINAHKAKANEDQRNEGQPNSGNSDSAT